MRWERLAPNVLSLHISGILVTSHQWHLAQVVDRRTMMQVFAQDSSFLSNITTCLQCMQAQACLQDTVFLSRNSRAWQAVGWADIIAPLAFFLREILSRSLQKKYEPAVQELAEAVISAAEAKLEGTGARLLKYACRLSSHA